MSILLSMIKWKLLQLHQLINKNQLHTKSDKNDTHMHLHAHTLKLSNCMIDRMNLPSQIDGICCLKWADTLQFPSYLDVIRFSNNTDVQETEGMPRRLNTKVYSRVDFYLIHISRLSLKLHNLFLILHEGLWFKWILNCFSILATCSDTFLI